jgi:cysteate synthase
MQPRRHYKLECPVCRAKFEDDGLRLECSGQHEPSLLQTNYHERRFSPDESAAGVYRYQRWLPAPYPLEGSGRTVTYRSEQLCRLTELPNLWIAFNGYWPERGAALESSTFKELEAYTVLARLPPECRDVLVVASAGNTAAAFARACSINRRPCLIVVPEVGLQKLQFTEPLDPCVRIVSLVGFTDYYDAITLAERVSRVAGFLAEGGVKNVARRDGLGTTMLNAVEAIGRLPDYYFQAIGSGAGGIAVNEAAKRLVADGGYGDALPRLMLSQNLPFIPIYLSWKSQRRELIALNSEDGKKQIRQIAAHVLSNRKPPYGIRGGVYDVLTETGGDMLVADNLETLHAGRVFEEAEKIDIDPASAVAFATLLKMARGGQIEPRARVLLHVTGGGWYRLGEERKLVPARPHLQLDESEAASEDALERVLALFN